MFDILIPPAYAQSTTSMFGGFDFMSFVPLVLMIGAFYFFLIRPQQKKMQDQREMLNKLSRGDQVIAAGGLIGTVTKILSENEVSIEISEGINVRVLRTTITENLSKKTGATSEGTSSILKSEPKKDLVVERKVKPSKKQPARRTKKVTSN